VVWPGGLRLYRAKPGGYNHTGFVRSRRHQRLRLRRHPHHRSWRLPRHRPPHPHPTPACTGNNNGVITLTEITTGTAPYTYAWSTGGTDNFINNLTPGEYCLTVTDANGCTAQACATITSEQVLDLEAQITNVCGEEHNGSIMLNASGGSGVYSYDWNTGQETATISNLAPGIFNVTVRDQDNCTETGTFEIITNAQPVIASAQITVATCATAGDGAIALTVSGGTAPYTYAWSNGDNTATIQNLDGAEYFVTVTDANGCIISGSYTTLPTTPQDAAPYVKRVRMFAVSLGAHPIETLIYDAEWVTTAAGCVFFTGGTEEISPQLLSAIAGEERKLRVEVETSEAMAEILVGSHFLGSAQMFPVSAISWGKEFSVALFSTMVDNNNILFDEFFFMGPDMNGNPLVDLRTLSNNLTKCAEIPQLMPDCTWSPTYTTLTTDNVHVLERKCLQVAFNFNFAAGSIQALASGGQTPYTFKWREEGENDVFATTASVSGLSPGRYCVSIMDNAGCSVQECVTLCLPLEDLIDELIEFTAPCPGGIMDGSICIETGYSYPLVYQWQNGASGECIGGLTAGSAYCLTVTDLACPQQLTYCTDPLLAVSPPVLVQGVSNPACPGGSNGRLSVIASGGQPPYAFLWSNGVSSPINDNLTAGNCYGVTLTDACGQTTSQCFNLPTYTQPVIADEYTHPACGSNPTGTVSLTLTGGLTPLSFSWSGPGGFTATTPGLNGVISGDYFVTVTDACGEMTTGGPFDVGMGFASSSIQVTEEITHICTVGETGAIDLTVQAANPTYLWSTGATTEDVSGLSAGQYSVSVSSGNCTLVDFFFVHMANVQIVTGEVAESCYGNPAGSIDIKPSGTFPPFQYTWSNGAMTEDLPSVLAGNYCVTVVDAEGCSNFLCIEVEDVPRPLIVVSSIINPPFQGSNGSIDLEVFGNAPFDYTWSNGAQTQDLEFLPTGNYIVTVTDENNCFSTEVVTITSCFNPPSNNMIPFEVADIKVTPLTAPTSGDGAIELVISYGSLPLFYEWTMVGTPGFHRYTKDISGLAEGRYCVTVTDGCTVWTHCQLVAYCGDFSVSGDYNENACLYLNGPSISLQVIPHNNNGSLQARWGDETFLHSVEANPGFSRTLNSGNLFGTETMTGSFLWTVLVEDEATCTAEYEFDLSELRATEDARWNLKYFSLIDPIESQVFYGLTALMNNSPYIGTPVSPYTDGCNRFRYCHGIETQINANAPLGCKSCNSANEYGICNCNPIFQMCVA